MRTNLDIYHVIASNGSTTLMVDCYSTRLLSVQQSMFLYRHGLLDVIYLLWKFTVPK
jgi:hypothetical protein